MGDPAQVGLTVIALLPALVLVLITVLRMRTELRRYGNAIWFTLALAAVISAGATLGVPGFGGVTAVVVIVVALSPLVTILLVVACVANGVVMLRREGTSLGNLLSLLLGLVMLALVLLLVLAVRTASVPLIAVALVGVLAAAYFAFVFVAVVLYAFVYAQIVRRRVLTRTVGAVIVLGSGLRRGTEVTPLLRGRIDEGLRVVAAAAQRGSQPVLVMSGGRGADEQVSEAEAMSHYALTQGVDPGRLLAEDRSTSTRENLRFVAALLAERKAAQLTAAPNAPDAASTAPGRPAGSSPPVQPDPPTLSIVVTSSYHAFRAAVEARQAGVDAHALGSRTASYFWLSATLREFVAFLREHRVAHAIMLALVAVPLPLVLLVIAVT